MVAHSATLAINEKLAARRAAGEQVVHLGFGEAGLPVLPELVEQLSRHSDLNSYGPVAGSLRAREAAAGHFTRHGLPTSAEQIVLAPGSKALLYALLAALPGDVVLPRPSWVTYAAQASLAGKRVVWVDVPADTGGVPDPELLSQALEQARAEGLNPGSMVLTLPDNPTGTLATADQVSRVCRIADDEGLAVISDEIYRDLVHDGSDFTSPAALLPESCFVTSGLSKNLALGGWRIGYARFPDSELGARVHDAVIGIASEVWSSLASPMQELTAHVLDEPEPVVAHIAASRHLHAAVSAAVHEEFVASGASVRTPRAAFYLYPDLSSLAQVRRRSLGADEVCEVLLDEHGVGVLSGAAFGDDPRAPRFRVATSLLYGQTPDQRWEALGASDPTRLEWVSAALEQLHTALEALQR